MHLSNVFCKTLYFLNVSPQKYAFDTGHFKVLLNTSMSMQMISDEMHSDTIVIRQKKKRKVVSYILAQSSNRSVRMESIFQET